MSKENFTSNRLESLDALRGFDMFWIAGGEGIIFALDKAKNTNFTYWAAEQMEHVPWDGFVFYDMIFPLFLFIAGVSLPFSIQKRRAKGESSKKFYKHAFTRLLLLILLGAIHNNLLDFKWEEMRYASVLSRIGIAWFFAAIIVFNSKPRTQIYWFSGFLILYWLMMKFIPVPGHGAGDLSMEGNLASYIDRMILPGRLHKTIHDPEGILSNIPAISTALLGALTGNFLMDDKFNLTKLKKGLIILLAGLVSLGLAKLWNLDFPINKNLWSSSFVLFAGGWSLIFLSVFYIIIDAWGLKKWAFPFKVIGLNSITIYMLQGDVIDFYRPTKFFFGGIISTLDPLNQSIYFNIAHILCVWTFLYILYKKKIFLKV